MRGRPLVLLLCAALVLSACGAGLPTPDAATTQTCQGFASVVHRIDTGKLKDRKGKKGKKARARVKKAVASILADAVRSSDVEVRRASVQLVAEARKGATAVRAAAADMSKACADAGVSDLSSPGASPTPS